jgi:FMN phosphatase YigB (HAD superfamily)
MKTVASFDIFDTVLTRKIGSPKSSFLILGRKLNQLGLIDCSAASFALIREEAEKRAFHNAGGLDSDISLHEIYQEVGFALRLPQESIQEIQQLELEIEAELLVPAPKALRLIEEARSKNFKIIYISDMYMEHDFLEGTLKRLGIFQPGDDLYVSNKYRKSKFSGELYKEVLTQEGVTAKRMVHCGNHTWSDVQSAQKSGVLVNPFLEGNLNRFEQIMEDYAFMSEGLSSAMAASSRLTRISHAAKSDREIALVDVAAGVAAPMLVGFTLWVLRRAQQLNIKRLYFLSRDGQILIEIAKKLIKKIDFNCELIYLYGSRQAWLLPSITSVNDSQINRLLPLEHDVDFLSPRIIFDRFCISVNEIQDGLEQLNIMPCDWDRSLSHEQIKLIRRHILSDLLLQDLILLRATEKRKTFIQYLEQVRLLEDDRFGVVDLGTGATLHHALAAVLETCGVTPPKSFYLGLRKGSDSEYGLPEAYLYDERYRLGFMQAPGLITFLEAVCSADHGSVLDYKNDLDVVRPILKDESNQAVDEWGYPIVRNTILTFAENLLLDFRLLNPWADVRTMIEHLQQEFWRDPSVKEAHAWSNFPLEDGWGKHSEALVLAKPYSVFDLPRLWLHIFRYGGIWWRRHWWHAAALKMTPFWFQKTFNGGSKVIKWVRKKL